MNEKKKVTALPFIIFGILFVFPHLIPLVVLGGVIYVYAKVISTVKNKKNNSSEESASSYNYEDTSSEDETFDDHEDDCINCGRDFDESDEEDNDCIFCGEGEDNYVSETYNRTYEKDTNTKDDFDLQQTLEDFGKSVTNIAQSIKQEYDSSSIKPNVDKASKWLKEELSVREKDDEEEASAYFGTYDDAKEEAEGLKALLKAGVMEKDEYEERMRELKRRK